MEFDIFNFTQYCTGIISSHYSLNADDLSDYDPDPGRKKSTMTLNSLLLFVLKQILFAAYVISGIIFIPNFSDHYILDLWFLLQ